MARSLRKTLGGAAAAALTATGLSSAAPAATGNGQTAHAFQFTSIDGAPVPLDQFAGKAVLIVNTASKCGFTPQYEGLQALWEAYRDRGLVVLGVPSNDFGGQEPGSEEEIKSFCTVNFNINFPMTEKEVVSGDGAHPFYAWAREQVGFVGSPKWNFHKYLIAPDGTLVDWFSSVTKPQSDRLVAAVEKVLPDATQ
ncbi:glutathione peroxidase [Roseospira marina]|uniref:Glutathione peroxidase n=1 Tax=Roseospira marina TaxID=140057 RepID=A0A5M6IG22_9PROT|nr:glutathione peroxidase [Roseospira marina]KAA5606709.1 glutathione peroxidase [Roseospira marina]MBB4313877.1 glutathione peroxidase [Roseospira marina]MBB5087039.1 glutathione peroxidase [Roseospira marina]